jgi:hypothetical protein
MEPRTPADLMDFRYSPTWPALATAFRTPAISTARPDALHADGRSGHGGGVILDPPV